MVARVSNQFSNTTIVHVIYAQKLSFISESLTEEHTLQISVLFINQTRKPDI